MAVTPDPDLAAKLSQYHESTQWWQGFQTWMLSAIGTILVGATGYFARTLKRITTLEGAILSHRADFERELASSQEDRAKLKSNYESLHGEHHRIREDLAKQPTKDDLYRTHNQLMEHIQMLREDLGIRNRQAPPREGP